MQQQLQQQQLQQQHAYSCSKLFLAEVSGSRDPDLVLVLEPNLAASNEVLESNENAPDLGSGTESSNSNVDQASFNCYHYNNNGQWQVGAIANDS